MVGHGNWTAFDRRMTRLAHKHMKDKCERCGTTEHLMVHHKDRDRSNNKPENLMTLCFSCHDVVEWENGRVKASHRTVCRVCGQPERAKGLCNIHYKRLRIHGDFDLHLRKAATCCICGEKSRARELCTKHYQQMRRHGGGKYEPLPWGCA